MKVLHVTNTFFFAERLLYAKLRALSDAGYDVHVACPAPRTLEGITCHAMPMRRTISPYDMVTYFQLKQLLLKEKFDIVHTHSAKAGFIGRLAAHAAEVPHIFHTYHGLPFYDGQNRVAYRLYSHLEKFVFSRADALFSQNREDMDALLAAGAPPKRVFYEGNGIDVDAYAPDAALRESTRKKLGLLDDDVAVGLFARIEPVKGHMVLFDALHHLSAPCRVLLAGANMGASGRYEHLVRRRAGACGCTLLPHQNDMRALLCAMDILVLPSKKEGIPRIVMEAMTTGLPVVATDVCGTREIVINGRTGLLVPYGDASALAHALETLISDATLRKSLGNNGRTYALAHFDECAVIAQMLRAYSFLCGT
jgi:glycosyltransferase involved in cell wall biosynthesis